MTMTFRQGTEEYYQKFIELQEKLRKSEEERLVLEMKFNEMMQVTREEEQSYYKKLRSQYKQFLEENRKRQERNDRILRLLERVESRASMLEAKTQRIQFLRRQYHSYLDRISAKNRNNNLRSVQNQEKAERCEPKVGDRTGDDGFTVLYDRRRDRSKRGGRGDDGNNQNDELKIEGRGGGNEPNVGDDESMLGYSQWRGGVDTSIGYNKRRVDEGPKVGYKHSKGGDDEIGDKYNQKKNDDYGSRVGYNYPITGVQVGSLHNNFNYPQDGIHKPQSSDFQSTSKFDSDFERSNDIPHTKDYLRRYAKLPDDHYDYKNGSYLRDPQNGHTYHPSNIAEDIMNSIHSRRRGSIYPTSLNLDNNSDTDSAVDAYTVQPDIGKVKGDPSLRKNVSFGEDRSEKNGSDLHQIEDEVENVDQAQTEENFDRNDQSQKVNSDKVVKIPDQRKTSIVNDGGLSLQGISGPSNEATGQAKGYHPQKPAAVGQAKDGQPQKPAELAGTRQQMESSPTKQNGEMLHNVQPATAGDRGEQLEGIDKPQGQGFEQPQVLEGIDKPHGQGFEQPQVLEGTRTSELQRKPVKGEVLEETKTSQPQQKVSPQESEIGQKLKGFEATKTPQEPEIGQKLEGVKGPQQGTVDGGSNEMLERMNKNTDLKHEPQKVEENPSEQLIQHLEQTNVPSIANPQVVGQTIQHDENGLRYADVQYDANGQPIHGKVLQYDQSGYDETQYGQLQYDENGQLLQHDANGQPYANQDSTGQPMQYDPGQPNSGQIPYDANYDPNNQPIQYDENGQPIQYEANDQNVHYDTNGQLVQYDSNNQPIQYDENNKPINQPIQSNENNQPIQLDSNNQPIQFDENNQPIQYDQNSQPIHYDSNNQPKQFDENNQPIQYDQSGQPTHYDSNNQPKQFDENNQPVQYDQNGQPIQYDSNNQPIQHDENKPIQYDPNNQPIEYNESNQPIQYDENNQPKHYDENNQPIQYDANNQPIQYDSNNEPIQYDSNNEPIHYDQNNQPIQYDLNSQPIQYDLNNQPIQYDGNNQPIQYDENNQPIQYDENNQPIQYDVNNQPIQYDANNQPIQYDENNQPIQYDANNQPIQYDNNGMPFGQPQEMHYDNANQQYDENGQLLQYDENGELVAYYPENYSETPQEATDPSSQVTLNGDGDAKKQNVLDLLETDTESGKQDTNKVSNDSDFDFSNAT